ncbi:MAG: RsmD family RNA methyltransferase [Bacteroidales bacterium]|nr:RsmD family RNA methyltransferase [Bacteroidales bacterium]
MRIISGINKGKRIDPGKRFKARPTTDFAKEGLFNVITNHFNIEDISVLDLFAGTGSISYEFASRGCQSIDTVELNPMHFDFIKKTASDLNYTQLKVYRADCIKFITNAKKSYSLIFADPPYDFQKIPEIPQLIFDNEILQPGGWFILEHGGKNNFTSHEKFFNHKKYGNVNFSIFKS